MVEEITAEMITEVVGNAHGNLARVKELIEAHPGLLNLKSSFDESPIEAATQLGNVAIIDYLVGKGAPCDFFTAIVLGRLEQVKAELTLNPGRARERGVHGLAPLYFAAIGGHPEVAQVLLDSGAGINEACEAAAPIHGALMGPKAEMMVPWLLERGADPNLRNHQGRTAKELAEAMKKTEVAALFG